MNKVYLYFKNSKVLISMLVITNIFFGALAYTYKKQIQYYEYINTLENKASNFSRNAATGEVITYKVLEDSPFSKSEGKYLLEPVGENGDILIYEVKTDKISIWKDYLAGKE